MKARIVTFLLLFVILYIIIANFRYGWINDCLTNFQKIKRVHEILGWSDKRHCKYQE